MAASEQTGSESNILSRTVSYSGGGLDLQSLEGMIETERGQQNDKVSDLKVLRERNVTIQSALQDEVQKLRQLSDYVSKGKLKGGAWANFKEVLSFIPGLKNLSITRRSIEELLRQQYEVSTRRVKEAAEFVDRLEVAEQDLYDEIDRLNERIIDAAKNERTAADYILELKAHMDALEGELEEAKANATKSNSVALREIQASRDKARRVLAEHSTKMKLYHTAEERLDRLKGGTDMLVQTISHLRSDISQYVMAAGEKLDMVAAQLRAIGTAADASVVILEMKRSLDSMGASLNETTRFVAETQAYFKSNLDSLIDNLEVYDDETRAALETNLAISNAAEQEQIKAAVEMAIDFKNTHS